MNRTMPIPQDKLKPRAAPRREGFVLPALLILAFVGVLFGLGRVLLYRYQCQQRIERQHELEKQYAVRSALRWIETRSVAQLNGITSETTKELSTSSGRSLGVVIRPVTPIYPARNNSQHFRIQENADYTPAKVFRTGDGEMCPEYKQIAGTSDKGCVIGPGNNTTGKVGRIVVDMSGTGSWLGDTYGRRYMANIPRINQALDTACEGDAIRLYIVPADTPNDAVDNAPAIGLTHITLGKTAVKSVQAWYRLHGSNIVLSTSVQGFQTKNAKGIQLAGSNICLFNAEYRPNAVAVGNYKFDGFATLPDELLAEFMVEGGGPKELKMVLEVKQSGPVWDGSPENYNLFDRFQVLPAYEFEVALNWPDRDNVYHSEVATVLHVVPPLETDTGDVFIYDTPGVSVRGYARKRQD